MESAPLCVNRLPRRGPHQPVADGEPHFCVRWQLNQDAVKPAGVEVVQDVVEPSGISDRVGGHGDAFFRRHTPYEDNGYPLCPRSHGPW